MQTNTHLARLIHDQAKKYGDREVLIYKDFGGTEWKSFSWNQFSQKVKIVSNALLNLGVKVQENVGVFSQNSIQYLFCDFGAWGIRAVTIPFYATSSEQQIQFMVNDAKVRFLFVGEQEQYDKARRVFSTCKTMERIIIFDKGVRIAEQDANAMYFDDFLKLGENLPRQTEVDALTAAASMDDIANHATKVLVLDHGRVRMYDTPQNVFARAEELQKIGLSVPAITKLCIEMNRRGASVPTSICTSEAFLNWIREEKKHA